MNMSLSFQILYYDLLDIKIDNALNSFLSYMRYIPGIFALSSYSVDNGSRAISSTVHEDNLAR